MTTTTLTPQAFLHRWQNSGGAERANYALFLSELTDLLQVPRPNPAVPDESQNTYTFDRAITATTPTGATVTNYIDLYKKAHFVLETKQGIQATDAATPQDPLPTPKTKSKKGHGTRGTRLWDDAMLRAKAQAENYVRHIPNDNPPFLLVVDVGYSIETYADFSGLGKTYTPFPDNLSHRIYLKDLLDPAKGPAALDRLRRIFTDPQSLNPARRSAKVTRDIADRLARLSLSLEKSGHDPEAVAHFLMRVLFTLFAEDVGLIPNHAFTDLLNSLRETPTKFAPMAMAVWQNMDKGGFSPVLREDLLKFNGGLFADTQALPLTGNQLELLIDAAKQDWSEVEPAIFGTLLERALHPDERHKLGAHYTPRAYVERLVLPTVIEPLREEWETAKNTAIKLAKKGGKNDIKKAVAAVGDFLKHLCSITVLDPACGSGNFLYVTLEHLKRLEGEVHDFLHTNFENVQLPLEYTGFTVDPHQLRGIEINPRAAAITDLVLWIGYLQWHFRTKGDTLPQEPVLKKFDNIECRDAVLAYDSKELARDEHGKPLTRWDGKTYKKHPITGEDIPDESARTAIYNYINPRKAEWPKADYVVGNPPFLGAQRFRSAFEGGYPEALWASHKDMPESADYVMYWWNHAAQLVREGSINRFGFITTNSITQEFNRRILDVHHNANVPISIIFAIPDHPWVDTADGAAVRIAMTTVKSGQHPGRIERVTRETEANDAIEVDLTSQAGLIRTNLRVGADLTSLEELRANERLCHMGVKLHGEGFLVSATEAGTLGLGRVPKLDQHIREFRSGRDLAARSRGLYAIDFYGLTADEVRKDFPEAFQHILQRVKPERDANNRASYRDNWWIFGEPRSALRPAIAPLARIIVTTRTARHRIFQFINSHIIPESEVVCIALDDAFFLGVLSSRLHIVWSLATGSRLGVGNDPRYNHSLCFNPFPFPDCTEKQKQKIRDIAEELDAHRKRQQAKFPDLTLTDMYNVLEKLRRIDRGELTHADISPKDKTIHTRGLIAILKQLHDDLDFAVAQAYNWPPNLLEDQLLQNLVKLNHQRAQEEAQGLIRYLRPTLQNPHPTSPPPHP